MGLDIHKYVVYGMQVTKQDITRIDKERVCEHDTDTTKKFCSECGAPVWETTECPVLEGNEKKGLSYFYH